MTLFHLFSFFVRASAVCPSLCCHQEMSVFLCPEKQLGGPDTGYYMLQPALAFNPAGAGAKVASGALYLATTRRPANGTAWP